MCLPTRGRLELAAAVVLAAQVLIWVIIYLKSGQAQFYQKGTSLLNYTITQVYTVTNSCLMSHA